MTSQGQTVVSQRVRPSWLILCCPPQAPTSLPCCDLSLLTVATFNFFNWLLECFKVCVYGFSKFQTVSAFADFTCVFVKHACRKPVGSLLVQGHLRAAITTLAWVHGKPQVRLVLSRWAQSGRRATLCSQSLLHGSREQIFNEAG